MIAPHLDPPSPALPQVTNHLDGRVWLGILHNSSSKHRSLQECLVAQLEYHQGSTEALHFAS